MKKVNKGVKKNLEADISNKTVFIVLILVFIVSLVSLTFYLDGSNETTVSQEEMVIDSPVAQGVASLEIVKPTDINGGAEK